MSKVSKSYGSEERSQFIISYEFQLPEVNNNLRLSKPFKTVKKQYAITTGITLVGTVGGTLGLFVGFSFIGTSSWLFGNIKLMLSKLRLGVNETIPEPPLIQINLK